MNEKAQLIKTAIMLELSKEGKTLADMEKELTKGMDKQAATLFDITKAPEMVQRMLSLLGGSAVVGGGALGAGAYGAYLANEDTDNRQIKKMKEKQQYIDATNALKDKMQNPITL